PLISTIATTTRGGMVFKVAILLGCVAYTLADVSSHSSFNGHGHSSHVPHKGRSSHHKAPVYHAPKHHPAPSYHAPAPSYHAPAPSYHAPAPSYHAPAPSYEKKAHPYDFAYGVKDDYTGNDFGHQETSNGDGSVSGQYHVLLPDGRRQVVTYTADHYNGYQAKVTYEGVAKYPVHQPSYHAPAPSYHAPAPSYHSPSPSYH
ncbi:unnamed protein product, partial [Meganyctiphanes norvegica]